MSAGSPTRRWLTGIAFLLPNIAGFCAFTLVPLAMSFVMAFTNWDILRHNRFRSEALQFVGFGNFSRLLADPQFWRDLGNTLYFTLGLPFAIAGSLAAALLLTRVSRRPASLAPALILATLLLAAAGGLMLAGGMAGQGVILIFVVMSAGVLVAGVATGGSVYRTLFYLPNFTAGVATFILWKKLYNAQTGPFNAVLAPPLESLSGMVRAAPGLFGTGLPWLCGLLGGALLAWQARRLVQRWDDGDAGASAVGAGILTGTIPLGLLLYWRGWGGTAATAIPVVIFAVHWALVVRRPRPLGPRRPADTGLGAELGLMLVGVPVLLLLAAGIVGGPALPAAAAKGLEPPDWLANYAWAKPALMIMGLWAAIGSNSMILYLAGLSNIPPELYEAADMDGASASQRFWHVTWPQLAPVTFFIAVMGMINGLQGGFEMARTMTLGGPAGATTTLSFYIFTQGFETGRLGYASAIAWVMFALVMIFTLLNFRFGNRDAND